ncbi:(1-_4)-alpha-D-glucan 1-alpha-D-glucosylmutase [Thermocatellispora tengchongensis]|uniref:(1->4)-alpha-D-glucan 1-alpha-D-glucosylmutase n=1 Tax=Thermocatellispora tengchongensis TaxID=1073253 RepID=A0A840PGF6_9ACTN|nr:malto-oligosyltrehalose synthase [Thermocatellispora tengchongensis]MBB5138069.1 (1->4)-alpha-D-glucan 1-alpha-D-glucosylmutase [Thermocatellispora tengchongensis]
MSEDAYAPPISTYRLQLTPDFGFDDVAELAPYLRDLGVTHVYLSPILQAVPESRHGYDVTDHSRVREEFGGIKGLRAMAERLAAHDLRIVLDIVPNHMTVPVPESGNAALWGVLRDGPKSPYARWFDIDWRDGKMAMPVLGDDGPDAVRADGDVLRYHDHEFPLPDDHYRLVSFREGPGYRRFFDVSSLIGLRVEDPEVFEATHQVILSLVEEGIVAGLRVDHPDGLADPRGYLARLSERTGGVWTVAEKILVGPELLPDDWPCAGTTGYDALNRITGLFVDPAGREPLIDLFVRQTGMPHDYAEVTYTSKRHVLDLFFTSEVDRLLAAIGGRPELRPALVELLAAMPVYRAYVVPGEPVPEESAGLVEVAARKAAARLGDREAVSEVERRVLYGPAEAVVRFQQTCGPVMAKGVEDTALYRWYPLACLNEVGGEPDHFGLPVADFHDYCDAMPPASMTTLSTHDTKRSEDVRARLAVLSEMHAEWREAVTAWSARVAFDPALDYLAWQNLMGAWPIDAERFAAYLLKAAREAKTAISWMSGDPDYERGIRDFAARAIEECGESVAAFTAAIEPYAMSNSLGQKIVQLMMPGVPDLYQGNEITDFSLVDPDNRRPVRYPCEPVTEWDSAKLRLTKAALAVRRRLGPGAAYEPLEADGPAAGHVIAFFRGDERAVAVATRLPVRLEREGGWRGTTIMLPPGRWHDLLTGCVHTGRLPLAHLLSRYPVALLERDAPRDA